MTKKEQEEIHSILRGLAWDKRDEAFHMTDDHGSYMKKVWQDELTGHSDRFELLATKIEELETEE